MPIDDREGDDRRTVPINPNVLLILPGDSPPVFHPSSLDTSIANLSEVMALCL